MAITLVKRVVEPAPEPPPSLTAGTEFCLLVDSVERQTRITTLCAQGLIQELRQLETGHPLLRYANILLIANEQLRQDLRAVLDEIRA